MSLLDNIFGTPNKNEAEAKQMQIELEQQARANQLFNKGTSSDIAQDLAITNYSKRLGNIQRERERARGNKFLSAEYIARRKARTVTAEGGRSTTAGRNTSLALLSSLAKAQAAERFTNTEQASLKLNEAVANMQHDMSRAIELGGTTIAGRAGVSYKKDQNWLKAAKLGLTIASAGQTAGLFGTMSAGGANAGIFDAIFNSKGIKAGSGGLGGGKFSSFLGSFLG